MFPLSLHLLISAPNCACKHGTYRKTPQHPNLGLRPDRKIHRRRAFDPPHSGFLEQVDTDLKIQLTLEKQIFEITDFQKGHLDSLDPLEDFSF